MTLPTVSDSPVLKRSRPPVERREARRSAASASIVYAPFSTKYYHEQTSELSNHSSGGMCFETSAPLRPGANLFIRTAQKASHPADGGTLRTTTLAQVRWCRKEKDLLGNRYSVGVRFY
jgi:hypothetical protein